MTPLFDTNVCYSDQRNDGFVRLTVGRNTRSIRKTSEFEAIIGIGRSGGILYQKEFDFCLMDCRQSRSGTLLVMGTSGSALEMSLSGEVLHHWYSPDRLPNGFNYPKAVPLHIDATSFQLLLVSLISWE
ncbi:MAG: hypothetical protein AAF633_12330 [Chloroflexota bacterium]